MKHGDFTELAKFYVNRPGYSAPLLTMLKNHVAISQGVSPSEVKAADVGAGTGKLTEVLASIGVTGFAVEPNDAMRAEGVKAFAESRAFAWSKGTAEETGLPENSVDWILMGSSFHWTDAPRAMADFHRALKPGGFFTAIWNPRHIEASELHQELEEIVYAEMPDRARVSSGATQTTESLAEKMFSTGQFKDIIFTEAPHFETMTVERYLNIWRSVNDIRVRAGEDGFARIMANLENCLQGMEEIAVPYLSRAWTVCAI